MRRYVAFLDILGFKEQLKVLNQKDAKLFIQKFSSSAAKEWERMEITCVNGYIVSDSFILYTCDISNKSLIQLLDLIKKICQREFVENDILIRGAVAKGEFDKIEAKELSSLQKGLIVGQAYVDAYLLEGSIKTAGIALADEVFEDAEVCSYCADCFYEQINGKDVCVMRCFNFAFFTEPQNIIKFTNLAINAQWLPHYYNTIYWALKDEKPNKANTLIDSIVGSINNGDPGENWRFLDSFIKGAFNDEVNINFQKRFLAYLRNCINSKGDDYKFLSKRDGKKERVLQYIASGRGVTKKQISSYIGVSQNTTSRIINELIDDGKVIITNKGRVQFYLPANANITLGKDF